MNGAANKKFFGRIYRICTVAATATTACEAPSDGVITNKQQKLDYSYWYDNVGNVSAMRDFTNVNQVQTFTYDDLNRLKTAGTNNVGAGQYSQSYSYDQIGNLLTRSTTVGGATTNWSYGYSTTDPTKTKPHAVTSMTSGTTNQSFGYDARGNMTTRNDLTGSYTQTFYVENRLTKVTKATGTTDFAYDYKGQRLKTVFGNRTVYDQFPNYEVEVRTGSGAATIKRAM